MKFSICPWFKFDIFFFQASSDDDTKDYTNLEKIQQFCRRFCTFIKGRFSRPESEVKVQGGLHLLKIWFWCLWSHVTQLIWNDNVYSYFDDNFQAKKKKNHFDVKMFSLQMIWLKNIVTLRDKSSFWSELSQAKWDKIG